MLLEQFSMHIACKLQSSCRSKLVGLYYRSNNETKTNTNLTQHVREHNNVTGVQQTFFHKVNKYQSLGLSTLPNINIFVANKKKLLLGNLA